MKVSGIIFDDSEDPIGDARIVWLPGDPQGKRGQRFMLAGKEHLEIREVLDFRFPVWFTREDGTFEFQVIDSDDLGWMLLTKDGYADRLVKTRDFVPRGSVGLDKAKPLSGNVLLSDGTPVGNAFVRVYSGSYGEEEFLRRQVQFITSHPPIDVAKVLSGKGGAFKVGNIDDSEYTIDITASTTTGASVVVCAALTEVVRGGTHRMFVLGDSSFRSVGWRTVRNDGSPLKDFRYRLIVAGQAVASGHTFACELPNGHLSIFARFPSKEREQLRLELSDRSNNNRTTVEFDLTGKRTILGEIALG